MADAAQRRGIDPGFSSMELYTLEHGVPVDDAADREALEVRWRPTAETIGDTVAWLYRAGHLTDRQAGKVAAA